MTLHPPSVLSHTPTHAHTHKTFSLNHGFESNPHNFPPFPPLPSSFLMSLILSKFFHLIKIRTAKRCAKINIKNLVDDDDDNMIKKKWWYNFEVQKNYLKNKIKKKNTWNINCRALNCVININKKMKWNEMKKTRN